uniref:peptidylprolyl isomerase n=1 Tax=Odontella aurita TaxID=265563 RepID=A0A7S4HM48_9STRA|mmetsp:Transcript_12188/g.35690  ORF Transcript_12188/g.35690 Transcript_12188/m.35690 type:complete len:471 (+) Transcript_12188:180-1592(+)
MRFSAVAATAAVLGTPCACAFSLSPAQRQGRTASALFASDDSGDSGPAFLRSLDLEGLSRAARGTAAAAALAAAVWSSPASLIGPSGLDGTNNNAIVASVVASAKEQASGSGSRVNKDAESLLRLGLPIKNKEVRKIATLVEDTKYNVSSKRKSAAIDNVKKTRTALASQKDKLAASCRDAQVCTDIVKSMLDDLDPLEKSVKESVDYLNGSDQERAALDKAYQVQTQVSKKLSDLEEQMVPKGYVTPVPEEYSDLPQLKGRATVEMVLKKADGGPFDVEGTNYPQAKMVMIIDGYTSPVTGGNFVDLVQKGFYDKMQIQRSDGFVVQTGDPDGEAEGYVGTPSKAVGKGKHGERIVPLEVFLKGDEGPFYSSTMEDEGRGGEATVLPFSSYGAMGWARDEYEPDSGSSQFFWLLFDSDLTPAGKNVLDGRYPCFGYVVDGADFLRDTKEGDIIVSAKVTEGADNLVQPK